MGPTQVCDQSQEARRPFEEESTALGDSLAHLVDDPEHSVHEEQLVLLGRSEAGRLFAVMHTERRFTLRLCPLRWIESGAVHRRITENPNRREGCMATVSFSAPEEVKRAFNEAFAGRNKSAIIAELMMQAVKEREQVQRRAVAIDRLLERRAQTSSVMDAEIRAAREELREWP
jgi:uncharacterized DUF497 family protein